MARTVHFTELRNWGAVNTLGELLPGDRLLMVYPGTTVKEASPTFSEVTYIGRGAKADTMFPVSNPHMFFRYEYSNGIVEHAHINDFGIAVIGAHKATSNNFVVMLDDVERRITIDYTRNAA